MHTAIVIPARYASKRLPGKPLLKLAGRTMLERVVRISEVAAQGLTNISVTVATDDERIRRHCDEIGVTVCMTPVDCLTGTDRVAFVLKQMQSTPDLILNMQGDAPLTPPDFLRAMIDAFAVSRPDAITPVTQLTWAELDTLRQNKLTTPFSGTTVAFDRHTGRAFWFSKNIIPAIRNESALRRNGDKSPVYRHIGLYGYSAEMLKKYSTLPESYFESLEGLEQLRMLENGCHIQCVPVDFRGRASMSGIDCPEDVSRAEKLIAQHGELIP